MTMKKGSYNFDEKNILEEEIERLEKFNDFSKLIEELKILSDIGLKDNKVVFDLGCGTGNIDFEIARHYKHCRVIGCDRNEYLIKRALETKEREGISNIDFIIGDAEEIPVLDESVDFCYSRIVFQHLRNPRKAVKELYRISRPGGIVAVVDTDDAGLILYPEPEGFSRFMKKIQKRQKELGGDRFIGRKLYELLNAEFRDVNCKTIPISNKLINNRKFIDIFTGYKLSILKDNNDNLLKSLSEWIKEDTWGIALCFMAYGKK
jgi:ubiquinone/menaquinone biosynthesis C-methylase UbiE